MNKWQLYYVNELHNGKTPTSKAGKMELAYLGHVKNKVIVHFPDFNGLHGLVPAHTETYVVTENDCDMPAGCISVQVLAANLVLWIGRGYKVQTA